MIQANKLRIGNYAFYKYWNPRPISPSFEFEIVKIVGFLKGTYYFEFLNKKGVHKIKELHPIPLTKEMLLKCGFKEYKLNDDLGYALKKEVCGILFKYDIDNSEAGVYVNHQVINVKYLHQLQNLYFALTNQELELNL